MGIDRLSEQAVQRVSGPSWEPLRQIFLDVSDKLLSVSSEPVGVLTTIYVKYQVSAATTSSVYAVAWLKTSKQIVVGFALPDTYESPLLGQAPQGMKYKGLTKYFTIKPGEAVPDSLEQWAKDAYDLVTTADQ